MERSVILANFQAGTGFTDTEYCISVLENHNWDLTAALADSLAEGVSDFESIPSAVTRHAQDQQTDTRDPSASPTFCVDTNPMGQPIDTTWPSNPSAQLPRFDFQPALERDSGPLLSAGSVRLLHFDIQLEEPAEDDSEVGFMSAAERFVYPETETVGSLKRHFINLKLAELTSLATTPTWSAIIPDITPQSLFAHLYFETSEGYDFSDNSTVLRALHLPLFSSIRATLTELPAGAIDDPTTLTSNAGVEQIELRVYVPLDADSATSNPDSGPQEYRSYMLSLQSDWPVSVVPRDAASLTGIVPIRQLWSDYQPSRDNRDPAPDSSTLAQLIAQLNRSCSSSTSRSGTAVTQSNNPTLAEFGLRAGTVYRLQLRDFSGRSSGPGTGNQSAASSINSSAPVHSTNDLAPAVVTDDDDDEPDFNDGLMESIAVNQPSVWSSPLISDSNEGGDPAEATEQFCTRFLQRYCSDGQTMAPPFSMGSLDSALASAIGNTVSERKPLFIYLHHDESVACHVFCQKVLCSVELGQFFGGNDLSVWPWDVTRPRSKERLFGWLESKARTLINTIASLPTDSYPVLAMIGKIAGQLEVLCVVLGTGAVSGLLLTAPVVGSNFPALTSVNRHVLKAFPTKTSGSLQPDVILAELWQAYMTYQELLAPERQAEVSRLASQRLREEQERAFQESLRLDRLKAEAAERERQHRAMLEKEKLREKAEASQRRLQVAATLPPEPPAPNTMAAETFLASDRGARGIASLRFRLPQDQAAPSPPANGLSGESICRRFAGSDKLKDVFAFVESKGYPISDFKLLTTFPRRDLSTLEDNASVADLGLVPQETLTLEHR